jgi:rhamnosyltransferase
MNQTLAGVVILYNPDDSVFENLKSYASFLDILYVVDNSVEINKSLVEKIKKSFSVEYIPHYENKGISYSLNEVLRLASRKYTWLLTMDQDSKFYQDSFIKYSATLSTVGADVYGICPTYEYPEKTGDENVSEELVQVNRCITSGNIIRIDLALKCGGFDENLFIDEVDHEFCYRCNQCGYKLLKYTPNILLHSLGNPIYGNLLGRHFKAFNEGSIRQYYIFRNKLYVASKYPQECRGYYLDLIKWFAKILLVEPDKWKKIKYVFRGCYDFKKKHFGKIRT